MFVLSSIVEVGGTGAEIMKNFYSRNALPMMTAAKYIEDLL